MTYLSQAMSDEIETEKMEECALIDAEEKVPMEDGSPTPSQDQPKPIDLLFGNPSLLPEQKIAQALEYMEKSLSQTGSPHFKEFWDARKHCLELFKENISPPIRTHLWEKYCELSKEARRLKEILDEQAAFAVEQIEIAIKAVEDEITHENEALTKATVVQFDPLPISLEEKVDEYIHAQRLLSLLNAQASRINSLRKELIKTEMRIRFKNKFFQRLSSAGDKVFPARKDLIRTISSRFISDVDEFITKHFPDNNPHGDIYFLREEIKAMQSMAKQLTLNTHAFTHTRRSLSDCWDKIKDIEKERKKLRSQQKALFKENQDAIDAEIKQVLENFNTEQLLLEDARKLYDNLNHKIRKTDLGRDEVRYLRDRLAEFRDAIENKEKTLLNAKAQEEQQKAALRVKKVQVIKEKIQETINSIDEISIEEISSRIQLLNEEMDTLHLVRHERSQLDRSFKELKDKLSAKKDQAIYALAIGGEGETNISALKEDVKKLQVHRAQIKEALDSLKKQLSNSGFDISKAYELNQQINIEKERYDKTSTALADLEKKLRTFRR